MIQNKKSAQYSRLLQTCTEIWLSRRKKLFRSDLTEFLLISINLKIH